jgi:prepilin-type N-terminal cleavage/methylation domain-containing protein
VRGARGFTLIELLASSLLLALVMTTGLELAARVHRDAREAEAVLLRAEARELGLLRLRAAAARSPDATMDRGRVVLRGSAGETAWCVRDGLVVRDADPAGCEPGGIVARRRGRATLLVVRGDVPVTLRVGGAR